jgi:hypothetical protein
MSKLNLLTQNSKIKFSGGGQSVVFNFGIPAFLSKSGVKTCPNAGVCATGCYARSGAYLFSNVAKKFEERFQATKRNSFGLEIQADLDKILKRYGTKKIYVRIHDSGDFYSEEYYRQWREIMIRNPEILFYAYTKQVEMFKRLAPLKPKNFILTFSFGGKQDHLIDVKNDRHSMVFESKSILKNQGYVNASEHDLQSLGPNKKVGLVFHHAKNFENTRWSEVSNKKTSEVL